MIFENYKSAVNLNLRNKDSLEWILRKNLEVFFFVFFFSGFSENWARPPGPSDTNLLTGYCEGNFEYKIIFVIFSRN